MYEAFSTLFQYPGRGYHNWGRPPPHPQALWARRSSWNSPGGCRPCSSSSPTASPALTSTSARPFYGYGLAGLGGVVGGSLRVRGPRASSSPHRHLHSVHPDEEESLLSPPATQSLHPPRPMLPGHFVPRRDRRALSLELPNLLQVPGPSHPPLPSHHLLPPMTFHVHQRKRSFSGGVVISGGVGGLESLAGLGGAHQDCNGKTPLAQLLQPPPKHSTEPFEGSNAQNQLMAEVFPQLNTRSKDQEELDDEIDYVSSF